MSGEVTPAQMGGHSDGVAVVRGETVDEFTGAVHSDAQRRCCASSAPEGAIDIVGTGGDGSGSYNVSTLASFIVAACGIPVAKHGNRALSSRSGAADVLAALGVDVGLTPEQIEPLHPRCRHRLHVRAAHHAAMKNVGPTRVELATRTIFNLLGPSPIRPASSDRWSAFSPSDVSNRWRRCWRISAPRRSGSSTAATGSTRSRISGPTAVASLDKGEIKSPRSRPSRLA